MQSDELIQMLQELVQVDIDSVHSYNRVLDEIEDDVIRNRLTEFRDSHNSHISALTDQIQSMGGQAPELTKDFKGYVIEAFAALGAAAGMKKALSALKTTEEITNQYYGRAVSEEMPEMSKELIRKHFSDEKVHLDYINENLKAL